MRRLLTIVAVLTLVPGGAQAARSLRGYHPPPRARRSVLDSAITPRGCVSWMGGTMLAVCDGALLQQVTSGSRVTEPGTLRVSVAGRQVRVGGTPALTQVVPADGRGASLGTANAVTLTGKASAGSVLYLRAQAITPDVYAVGDAIFTHLGLERGGRATVTIHVVGDHLRYTLRRPDGTSVDPAAVAGMGGPGTAVAPAPLVPSYADTSRTAARTYVAAVNARDGKTLCSLFARTLQARYATVPRMPCWAAVSAFIDFTGENSPRAFDSVRLVHLGTPRRRAVGGHSYLGLPLKLDVRFVRVSSAKAARVRLRESVDDVLWLERSGRVWRVAKPSLAMMAAAAIGTTVPDPDPLAPPGFRPGRR